MALKNTASTRVPRTSIKGELKHERKNDLQGSLYFKAQRAWGIVQWANETQPPGGPSLFRRGNPCCVLQVRNIERNRSRVAFTGLSPECKTRSSKISPKCLPLFKDNQSVFKIVVNPINKLNPRASSRHQPCGHSIYL